MNHELESALSVERFSRYLEWAEKDRDRALELYSLNTRVSESLYTPLQMLEVTLRNRIHSVMTDAMHERWFEEAGFLSVENQRKQLSTVRVHLSSSRKELTSGQYIAALSFSFWTSMLAPNYEILWQKTLNCIAQRDDGKGLHRKQLSVPLSQIRSIRNRIAHHEPIIHLNLLCEYRNIMQITRWLSSVAADWSECHSRFPSVHPSERVVLAKHHKMR